MIYEPSAPNLPTLNNVNDNEYGGDEDDDDHDLLARFYKIRGFVKNFVRKYGILIL